MKDDLEKHGMSYEDTLPHYGIAHYCITGDEPYCDILKHREHERREQLIAAHGLVREGGHHYDDYY
jgi:hypothetical protein